MATSLGAFSTGVFAEEAVSSVTNTSETIAHIEKALEKVNQSDFSAARLHLKAARLSSEKITGNEAIVKEANADVIKGQILSNQGESKQSADELSKALVLYKSL